MTTTETEPVEYIRCPMCNTLILERDVIVGETLDYWEPSAGTLPLDGTFFFHGDCEWTADGCEFVTKDEPIKYVDDEQ